VVYDIIEIDEGHPSWSALLQVAPLMDEAIARQLALQADHFRTSHVLVALDGERPVGVLRFVTQRLGEDEERPPVVFKGETLVEAKVISFGVVPERRRQGIGRTLQEKALAMAREMGCYQLRSRSWYHSRANYHLKISMGCGIQPSLQDDSVYFIKVL
jgi:GNAT superfamily N-acetyltransferase